MTQDPKIALEQFRNIIGYLQYENTAYWTRSGFLLASQAALLGFSARIVPTTAHVDNVPSMVISIALALLALAICWIGLKMIENSVTWINRWIGILEQIEPVAYGEIKVFRDLESPNDGPMSHFSRETAKYLIYVFVIAWFLLIVYSGYLLLSTPAPVNPELLQHKVQSSAPC